ncbi:MAG: hypothetical protein GTO17_01970 [Candidatus Aminicenantes bacterium]|nr:hypothetical protein [Candidatus Aminicenantes bacterium]
MCKKLKKPLPLAIFIALFFFLLFLPLRADESESKENLVVKEEAQVKGKAIELNSSPPEKKSSISLKSFQLTEKGIKPYKIKLDFSPQQIDINPGSHRFVKKPKESSSILYTSSLITLTCLNIADYCTTVKALKYKSLDETNPLMKPFTKSTLLYTTVKLGLTAYNYYFLNKLYKKDKTLAWAVSLVANFALSYVVANNLKNIQEAQHQ